MGSLILEEPWLADYQQAILGSKARITITEACTKSGKSISHSWWNYRGAHDPIEPGDEYLWIGPSYQQVKMIFEDVARTVAPSGMYRVNVSEMTITTPAEGVLRYRTGEKPDLLYGPSNVRQIVIDEYTRCRPEVFTVCQTMLTATGGPLKMIGNFIGNANWGHQLKVKMAGDPEFECFTITAPMAVKAGIIKQERVDHARKTLHHSEFMALYMCEGSAHPLQLMRADAINDIWTNEVAEGTHYLTADIARFGRDRTIVGLWSGLRLVDIVQYPQQDLVITSAGIDQLARQHKVMRSHIVIDEGGVGGGVVDILKGCVPFDGASKALEQANRPQNYGNLRSQCYFTLADHVNEGLIGIADECSSFRDHIAIELEAVRRLEDQAEGKLKVVKKEEMKELLGRSPDLADMLMMRMYAELRGVGTLVNTSITRKVKRWDKRNLMHGLKSTWR